jgi:hypothetical protein
VITVFILYVIHVVGLTMNLFKTIKNNLIAFFADIRIYIGGIVLFGESHYQIKGPHLRQILDVIQPGDILLRRYDHYLGSLLIPGYWSHVAIYVGDGKVVHMLREGITEEDILTFTRCDNILILRSKNSGLIKSAIEYTKKELSLNVQYDYDFKADNEELYCCELVYNAFNKPPYNVEHKYSYILPDDFLRMGFDIIWQKEI